MAYESSVEIVPTDLSAAGVLSTTLATTPTATHGNKVKNDGKTFVEINNGSGSPITVTFDVPSPVDSLVDGLTVPDRTVTIAAGARYKIGPWKSMYNQSDGYVWFICSAVTTVTAAAYRNP